MSVYQWLNKEKARFFKITVQQSQDEIILNHVWGGCNSNRGGQKSLLVNTQEEAQKYIYLMMKRRKSRGYELISG
jgi:predicted DNA-binding WGR domain protein